MTSSELQARAIQRAHDRHIHVMKAAGRPGVYTVSSASEPGVKHTLIAGTDGESCSCKGFFYRKSCCHVEALRNRLAREAAKAAPAPVAAAPTPEDCVCDLYNLERGEVCKGCGRIG